MGPGYLEKVNGFITPFLEKNGYELIKSEFVEEDHNWYLRLYIDLTADEQKKRAASAYEEGSDNLSEAEQEVQDILDEIDPERAAAREEFVPLVNISDCAKVSRYLSKWLDREDFISEAYTLEVCSRGFMD